jgi:hypothetical protein
MGFLLVVIFVIFIVEGAIAAARRQDAMLAATPKTCPPHQWAHVEVRDESDEVVAWKLICSACGPFKGDSQP